MMLSSTTPMGPLTRRSSERELNECSGKKRAASAGGLSNRSTDGEFVYIYIFSRRFLVFKYSMYKLYFGKRNCLFER